MRAGISVRYDDKFRPYYLNGDTLIVPVDKDMQQYYVKGLAPGKWTFNADRDGQPVGTGCDRDGDGRSQSNLGAALSRTTGLNPGDTVVITAPAGMVFSQTSAVTFTTGTVVVVNRAADSTDQGDRRSGHFRDRDGDQGWHGSQSGHRLPDAGHDQRARRGSERDRRADDPVDGIASLRRHHDRHPRRWAPIHSELGDQYRREAGVDPVAVG